MFEMFSLQHGAALAAGALFFTAIIVFRARLSGKNASLRFRWLMCALLLGCELSLQASYLIEGEWDAASLPFQLCSMTLLLSAVALAFRVQRLYPIIFFLGTLGALQAMVTPNLLQSFPHFRYFHFFAAHIGIIAAALYLIAVERYRPTFRSMIQALVWLHVLALPAAVVNIVTGTTNFMFLARKPATASLLDALAPWPWYLLQLELVAVMLCLLLLAGANFAYWISGRRSSRKRTSRLG